MMGGFEILGWWIVALAILLLAFGLMAASPFYLPEPDRPEEDPLGDIKQDYDYAMGGFVTFVVVMIVIMAVILAVAAFV